MKEINYYRNIHLNYGFIFLKNMNLTNGIWMLLLVSKGQSLFQIGVLECVFHITSFIMETPTGAVADLFGRKTSRLIAVIMSILSSILFITSNNFSGYVLAFIICALSYNFESGAGEALVYDALILEKKENRFMKITGNIEVIMQLTGMISLIIGGIIGNHSYTMTYLIGIGISIVTLIAGLFFKEPKNRKSEKKERVTFIEAIKSQYQDCIVLLRSSKKLVYLISFSSAMSTFVTLSFYYIQVAWKRDSFTEGQIGVFLAISCLFGAIGGLMGSKIDRIFGEKVVLKYSPFIYIIAIASFYFVKTSVIAFAIVSMVDSILFVTTRDYIHKLIPSEKRATIISFESTVFSVFMICLFPLFGMISDFIGIRFSFLLLGAVLVLLSLNNVRRMSKMIFV